MPINLIDRAPLDGVRKTADGYLTAFSRVARTGIQVYKGSELGRPDLGDVRVYRPPEEVFADDALHSIAHRPLTLDHPSTPVDANNWGKLAKGHIGGDVLRDGEFIRVPLCLMDAASVTKVESRAQNELSLGYSTEIIWGAGKTPAGEMYDAKQTQIRANHLAVVADARGGSNLRIGDENGDDEMSTATLRSIMVDSVPVEVTDVAASVINRALAVKDQAIADAEKKAKANADEAEKVTKDAAAAALKAKTDLETKDGQIAALTKEVADAKAATTPDKLDAIVSDRLAVRSKAAKALGDKYVSDGKTNEVIRREVVTAKLGDAAVKTMSDAEIIGAFGVITADAKGAAPAGALGGTGDLVRAFSSDGRPPANAVEMRDKAYADTGAALKDAWRFPNGRPPAAGAAQ